MDSSYLLTGPSIKKPLMINYLSFYKKYIRSVLQPDYITDVKDMFYWKNRLFYNIFIYIAPLSIIVLLLSIYITFRAGVYIECLVSTFVLSLMIMAVINVKISINQRKLIFILVTYYLAVILFYYVNSPGAGLFYLLTITIITAIIYSSSMAFFSAWVNTIICFSFGVRLYFKIDTPIISDYTFGTWVAVSSNLILLSFICVQCVKLMFKNLELYIDNKKKSEANLIAMIENTDAYIYSLDKNLKYISFNQKLKNSVENRYHVTINPGDKVFDFLETLLPGEEREWKDAYNEALCGKAVKLEKEFIIGNTNNVTAVSINPILEKDEVIGLSCFARDVTQEKKSEQALIRSGIQIRNFAKHINNVLEEERAHLAREIHDELGQQLIGIKIGLSYFIKKNTFDKKHDDIVNGMIKQVDATLQSMRIIATELRPGILDSLGLAASIQWLANELKKREGIEWSFKTNIIDEKFEKNISTCFFRVCQEALTNISKHSQATKIDIEINYTDHFLVLKVSDNGKGITNEKLENPFSMGLLGMRERANLIDANIEIANREEGGVLLELTAKIH